MTRYIIRKYLNGGDKGGRKKAGMLLAAAGIFFDLLLFAVKYLAGMLSGSVAVTADAFNNLTDAGAHITALLAFPLGARKPSRRFPFGPGRLEYLSGLFIAVAVLAVSGKMILSSVTKILHPSAVESSPTVIVILIFSITVKGYMYRYNTVIGKRIDSAGLRSVAVDSICDCFATGTIILSILMQQATGLNIDGWAGLAVAGCILYAGLIAARDSLVPLLGTAVDEKALVMLYEIAESCGIRSVSDIALHDYGPEHRLLTMRIEADAQEESLKKMKQMIGERMHMETVIERNNG